MIEQFLRFFREVLDIFFSVSLESVLDLTAELQNSFVDKMLKAIITSLAGTKESAKSIRTYCVYSLSVL
ncbi:hypothetical protein HZS_6078 [Henneguya salminicola]|nr:hypothetical protein HZS_6078 [Henneguya salminicola]